MVPSVGSVVDDDDFLERIPLIEHRFQASLDEAAAIVSDDRDGYEVVMRHEQEPRIESPICEKYPTTRKTDYDPLDLPLAHMLPWA